MLQKYSNMPQMIYLFLKVAVANLFLNNDEMNEILFSVTLKHAIMVNTSSHTSQINSICFQK